MTLWFFRAILFSPVKEESEDKKPDALNPTDFRLKIPTKWLSWFFGDFFSNQIEPLKKVWIRFILSSFELCCLSLLPSVPCKKWHSALQPWLKPEEAALHEVGWNYFIDFVFNWGLWENLLVRGQSLFDLSQQKTCSTCLQNFKWQ